MCAFEILGNILLKYSITFRLGNNVLFMGNALTNLGAVNSRKK